MESPYKAEEAKKKLENLWMGDRMCPICGCRTYEFDDETLAIPVRQGLNETVEGLYWDYWVAICSTCGYTRFFKADKLTK